MNQGVASTVSKKKGWREALTENLRLKALAFVLAALFYSLFHETQESRSIPASLSLRLPPPEVRRVLMSRPPPQVRVTLRGPRSALEEVHPDDLTYEVDLSDGQKTHVPLETTRVHLPPGLRAEAIEPSVIDVLWDDQITRDIPVQATVAGTLAPGLVLRGPPIPEPRTVHVSGPRSEVSVLQHVRAEPLDINGLGPGGVARDVRLDRAIGRSEVDPAVMGVTIRVEVVPELAERTFVRVPVTVVGPVKGRVQPQEIDVRVRCPPAIDRALRVEQILPRVNIKSPLPTGTESLPVYVSLDACETSLVPPQVIVRW